MRAARKPQRVSDAAATAARARATRPPLLCNAHRQNAATKCGNSGSITRWCNDTVHPRAMKAQQTMVVLRWSVAGGHRLPLANSSSKLRPRTAPPCHAHSAPANCHMKSSDDANATKAHHGTQYAHVLRVIKSHVTRGDARSEESRGNEERAWAVHTAVRNTTNRSMHGRNVTFANV